MKRPRCAALAGLVLAAAAFEPSCAAPARAAAPFAEPQRQQIRSVCHHYRWSSRRHCTSAKTLRFVARPPLYYPSRYFGGRPHYAHEQYLYWRRSWYARHGWYRWPYRYYGY